MNYALTGGLGNQILQLAHLITLVEQGVIMRDSVRLDISWFYRDQGVGRNFLLDDLFGSEVLDLYSSRRVTAGGRFVQYLEKIKSKTYFGKLIISKKVELLRNWQSFNRSSVGLAILKNKIQTNSCDTQNDVADRLCIHLRFGDYVENHKYNVVDYERLIKFSLGVFPTISGIDIFSDDMIRSKIIMSKLKLECDVRFVQGSELQDFFQLLNYDKMVCSNSTFSVSAAILGIATQIVVPEFWKIDVKLPICDVRGKKYYVYS